MSALRGRVATLPLVAGSPVLDLVNTVSWRGDPMHSEDHLATVDDCLVWVVRAEVLTGSEADDLRRRLTDIAAPTLVDDLHGLRDLVAELVDDPGGAAMDRAREPILDALAHSELHPGGSDRAAYAWRVTGLDERTAARRLALDLHALLTTRSGPIRLCADDRCRWVFVDTSRGHRRRWCDSRDCGNRHRVRTHQQRSAATT